jgi:F0F1-type ATP synthase assembly protein I
MPFLIKLLIANCVIVFCVQIGRVFPTLSGLIATMPLTGAIVLVWLHSRYPADTGLLAGYTKGALWGIVPSILFFAVALMGIRRGWSFIGVLMLGFGVWLVGAAIHQWWMR